MLSNAQRIFDVLGAAAGLAVFAPVMAIIAVAIMAEDGVRCCFDRNGSDIAVGHSRF